MADTGAPGATGKTGKRVDVEEVIDSANFFPVPFGIAVMMIIIMLTDGFDLGTMGRVAEPLVADWGITRADLGPINTWGLVGMAIGSVGLGWVGDKIGRKKAYIACLALLFVGSLLCYFSTSVTQLTVFRLITGFGLGGVTPLATTLMSEWAAKHVRSVAVAAVIVAVPLGAYLAGPIERILIPEYGWRSMFLAGAVAPLVLFVAFAYLLPESPKFMARHPAQHKRLAGWLNRLVGEKRYDGTEDFYVSEGRKEEPGAEAVAPEAPKDNMRVGLGLFAGAAILVLLGFLWEPLKGFAIILAVLQVLAGLYAMFKTKILGDRVTWLDVIYTREFRTTTILIWTAFAVNSFVLYVFTNYLQPLLAFAGQPDGTASQAADLFFIGAFFGSVGGAVLIGWFGSRLVGVCLAMLGVIGTAIIAMVLSPTVAAGLLLILCLLTGMSINGMQAFLYAVTANAYPTAVRGAAVGMAQTFSRIGAVLSPMAASTYFLIAEPEADAAAATAEPLVPVGYFLIFVAACALITTVSYFLIPRHIEPGRKKKEAAATVGRDQQAEELGQSGP